MNTQTKVDTQKASEVITWQIDPDHSKLEFSVSHMVISHVTGHFRKFEGKVTTHGDRFEEATAELSIDAASIDTNNEMRDNHLRSAEFIDVAQYPFITFKSTLVNKVNENTFIITGDLTLRGVTRPVELSVKYNGFVKDPFNNIRAGFKVSGIINRKDYEVNWSGTLDTGGLIAGNTVEITGNIEIIHPAG